MTSRERVFAALRHEQPDRVPYVAQLYPEIAERLNAALPPGTDYREFYGEDIRWIHVHYPERKTIRLADNYFPMPSKEALQKAREQVQRARDNGWVTCSGYVPGIFEHIKMLTSDEYALTHMLLEPEDMHRQIGHVAEWLCRLHACYAGLGFDLCFSGDDLGTQRSTIMSLDSYREFYRPWHAELVRRIKAVNPAVKVAFHCCGYIGTILPEWIDIGVDIVHSVQPEANDLAALKAEYGRKIVFWGALGLQQEFFYLERDAMADRIRQTLAIMAPGGGYIACSSNAVTAEVPVDKVKLLYAILQNQVPSPPA
jgi:uroporphyrinogen decarboxylase